MLTGQGRAAGKISSGEEDEGLSLITDLLSSIVRSELMEERRDEERRDEERLLLIYK